MNSSKNMRPPTWFRAASWLALLWMLSGAAAFAMDLMTDEAALAQMTSAQRELYEARPQWLFAMYAVAIVSGLAGAMGLLLRKTWAVPVLAVSLVAVAIQFGYMTFGMNAIERVGAAQALTLPIFVFIAGSLVLWLAMNAKTRGWISA
jgi:hypothetical protein